jgi:hypothetical protein
MLGRKWLLTGLGAGRQHSETECCFLEAPHQADVSQGACYSGVASCLQSVLNSLYPHNCALLQ